MILALATGPLAQAIGWALLHLLWQGTVIAGLLALLLRLLPARSASLRYTLACAALVSLVLLGVATGYRAYPRQTAVAAATIATPDVRPSMATIVVATLAPARGAGVQDVVRAANDALPAVVTFWLVGVVLLSIRLIVHWLRARRLVTRHTSPATEPWLSVAKRLCRALGVRQAVRLLESTAIQVPAVVGLLRPVILLPANALAGLMPGQLEMILAHELAHIRRHDFLVNLLQAAVETLLFYHPAVWWISGQIRIERENCCDDLAIAVCGNALQYARALTRLEELRAQRMPLAVSANGGSLLDRIRRLVSESSRTTGPVRGAAALALLVGMLLAIAAPSFSANARREGAKPGRRDETTLMKRSASKEESTRKPSAKVGDDEEAPDTRSLQFVDSADDIPDPYREAMRARQSSPAEASGQADAGCPTGSTRTTTVSRTSTETSTATATDMISVAGSSSRKPPKLSVDDLIALRAQNVTPQMIDDMRTLFPDIEPREMASMAAVGVTPEFVSEMREAGIDVRSASDATSLAAVGVTPRYIRQMRDAGLTVESASQASSLAAVGVTPEFIRDMRDAGLTVESASEASGLAAVGVTPEFIRDMRDAGLPVESAHEAQSLAAVGVTARFIRDMRAAGLTVKSAEDASGLAAVGVTSEFIAGMRAAGLSVESAHEAQGLAAVGVTPDYVRQMRDAGVAITKACDAQSLAAVGVTPKFVRQLARAGYTDLTAKELSRLAAGGVTDSFIREMSQYRSK